MKKNNETVGTFSGFVLLEEKKWDKAQFKKDFVDDWDLQPVYEEGDEKKEDNNSVDAVIMELNGQRVVLGYMDIPVPDGEAEKNAVYNYTWKEAVEVTGKHKAHMIVMIMGEHNDVNADGELFIKVVSTLCKQKNVIGIYANGLVYQPKFYLAMEEALKMEIFPLMGLVWVHMVREDEGYSLYTIGMNNFGKDEMEVIKYNGDPIEVRDFLLDVASYCIEEDVTLRDGETIGLTAEQICKIKRSKGVYVGNKSLKIDYHE